MDTMESCVPPGFRFHPTDEELVGYYLKKKVASQKIDLDVIRDIDLYRIEPWDLQGSDHYFPATCRIGYEEQNEWYFFSHKDKKYPSGTRTNRATMAGFWKATGRDKAVYDKLKLMGMRKTLVFYKGRAPNGQKTEWIMHEYRLESEENGPPQEEGWVVCRAFKKRPTGQTKSNGGWEPTYFYDDPTAVSSVMDPTHYLTNRPQNFISQKFTCKEETESENLNIVRISDDQFLLLPQLESPSQLPLMERPSSLTSPVSKNNEEEDDRIIRGCNKITKTVTTDWRELDRFVASQLSQEDRIESDGNGMSSFGEENNSSDMAVLRLLQSGGEEAHKFNNGFFTSSPDDCDIGICIFDK